MMAGSFEQNGGTSLGRRIRQTRMERQKSLRWLAAELGVSPATVSQLENDRAHLTVSRLHRIAELLDTSVAGLLESTSADVPPPLSGAREELATRPNAVDDWRNYAPLRLDPILQGALSEFMQAGYHGTSVRDIARRCELSVAGLYHYYPTKQDMLYALLHYTMTDLLARAEAARSEGHDPASRFALLVEHLALYHTHRRDLGFLGASEMRSLGPENRHRITGMRDRQQHMVDKEVADGVRCGMFHTSRPEEAARAVATMCTALTTWFNPDGPLTPEEIAEHYVEFALNLVRAY